MSDPVQTRTYSSATEAAAAQQYGVDAAEAAKHGWMPVATSWDGLALSVTYRHQPQAAGLTRSVPEHLIVRPRAAGIGTYVKAIGLALVVAIIVYMLAVALLGSTPARGTIALVFGVAAGIAVGGKWQRVRGPRQWFIVSAGVVGGVVALFVALFALMFSMLSDNLDQTFGDAGAFNGSAERRIVLDVNDIVGEFNTTMVQMGAAGDGDPTTWAYASGVDRARLGQIAGRLAIVAEAAPEDRRSALLPLALILEREAQAFDDVAMAIATGDEVGYDQAVMEMQHAHRDSPAAMRAFLEGYRDVLTVDEARQLEQVSAAVDS